MPSSRLRRSRNRAIASGVSGDAGEGHAAAGVAGESDHLGVVVVHGNEHVNNLEATNVSSNYQLVPAGEVEVEIVAASIGEVAWKASTDNPRGECLRLRLSAGRDYGFVFADVPLDWTRMLDAVRAATGVSGDMVPEEFTGQRARVVLKHYQAKDGSTRASVAKWVPRAKQVQAQRSGESPTLVDAINDWKREPSASPTKSAPPKVSRNAPPQYGADDDIPF